jgi:hypothetical protein
MSMDESALGAARHLLPSDERQLLEELGLRDRAISEAPELAGEFDLDLPYDETEMGMKDELRNLGARILRRWNREAYELVCGGRAADTQVRSSLTRALGIGQVEATALLSVTLVTHLAVPAALAAVIAAIVIKRFFSPAAEEVCARWKTTVEPASGRSARDHRG